MQQPHQAHQTHQPLSPWAPPMKPEASRPETPQQASPVMGRPATTASLTAIARKPPGSDLDVLEVSDQEEMLDEAKALRPLSGRPQSRGAWVESPQAAAGVTVEARCSRDGSCRSSKQSQQPQSPPDRLRACVSDKDGPGLKDTGTTIAGMNNCSSIGAPARRVSLKRYNTMGLGFKRSKSRSFAVVRLGDERPVWMRALNSLNSNFNNRAAEKAQQIQQFIAEARKAAQDRPLFKVVHGGTFQSIASFMIVLNALYIGANTEATLNAEMAGRQPHSLWGVGDIIFATWFTLELLMKLWAERTMFVFGAEWQWNFMDTVLVAASIIDVVVNIMTPGTSSNGTAANNITTARILRLARFVRLFRLVHTIRFLSSFRIVVLGILQSLSSLYWCFLVIGFIIYMFAVFFMNGVSEFYKDQGGMQDTQLSRDLSELYGGLQPAMVTLFMAISGGLDWTEALRPLTGMNGLYEPVFLFYIFFMFFAVLNVVIGTFVATTSEISSRDRDTMVKAEITKWEGYAKKIKEFFHEADTDKSGMLSWEEFEAHLQTPRVRAYFQALELDVSQAYALFKILDVDGTGEVTPDEFVDGCMRLKNQAKSLDIKLLMYQNEMVFSKLKVFMEFAMHRFTSIDAKMTSVLGGYASASAHSTVHVDWDKQSHPLRAAGDEDEVDDPLQMRGPASPKAALPGTCPPLAGEEDEV